MWITTSSSFGGDYSIKHPLCDHETLNVHSIKQSITGIDKDKETSSKKLTFACKVLIVFKLQILKENVPNWKTGTMTNFKRIPSRVGVEKIEKYNSNPSSKNTGSRSRSRPHFTKST